MYRLAVYSANFNIPTIQYNTWTSSYALPHYGILNANEVSFSSLAYIHICTSTFRQTMCQTGSPLTLSLSSNFNCSHTNHTMYSEPLCSLENNSVFFTSNSNGSLANPARFGEPFCSQENNNVFFTSNSIGSHAKHTGTVNHCVHLDIIIYAILIEATPTKMVLLTIVFTRRKSRMQF